MMLADSYQEDSKLLSPGKQPAITLIAAMPDESSPEAVPQVPNKVIEENRRKKTEKESVAASPRSPMASDKDEEDQEEQPDLVTLRTEYATLSQQLEQLDVNKQAGQWARLYKQVRAAEERLRHAEQDASPSPTKPPENAKPREAQAHTGGTHTPPAEGTTADERQEQLWAIARDLIYWREGLKVLQQACLPKWRGYFKWQIEAKIELLQTEYAKLRAECAKPDG
jgi:hypothetical protein